MRRLALTTQEECALERLRCSPVPYRFVGGSLQLNAFAALTKRKRPLAKFVRSRSFVGFVLEGGHQ